MDHDREGEDVEHASTQEHDYNLQVTFVRKKCEIESGQSPHSQCFLSCKECLWVEGIFGRA